MNFPLCFYLTLLPSCIAIGYIDYLVLNRWTKCDSCGWENKLWYKWILPTFIEIALFCLGILIGIRIASG